MPRSCTSASPRTPTPTALLPLVALPSTNSRARRVVGEYERHARRIDEHCAGTHAEDDGPVLRRLREVGVSGLAVGAFGEAPDDAQSLLGLVATTGAAERLRDAMTPSPLG